jgi:hypothetical protein
MEISDIQDEDTVVVCNPVKLGLPSVASAKPHKCDFCGEEVWLAQSTIDQFSPGEKIILLCLFCMTKIPKHELQFRTVAKNQLEEIVEKLKDMGENVSEGQLKEQLDETIEGMNKANKFETN